MFLPLDSQSLARIAFKGTFSHTFRGRSPQNTFRAIPPLWTCKQEGLLKSSHREKILFRLLGFGTRLPAGPSRQW